MSSLTSNLWPSGNLGLTLTRVQYICTLKPKSHIPWCFPAEILLSCCSGGSGSRQSICAPGRLSASLRLLKLYPLEKAALSNGDWTDQLFSLIWSRYASGCWQSRWPQHVVVEDPKAYELLHCPYVSKAKFEIEKTNLLADITVVTLYFLLEKTMHIISNIMPHLAVIWFAS